MEVEGGLLGKKEGQVQLFLSEKVPSHTCCVFRQCCDHLALDHFVCAAAQKLIKNVCSRTDSVL